MLLFIIYSTRTQDDYDDCMEKMKQQMKDTNYTSE